MNVHVHEHLDEFGYCELCQKRVMTHFRGFPLADRLCPVCDHGLQRHTDERAGFWCHECNDEDGSAGPCF